MIYLFLLTEQISDDDDDDDEIMQHMFSLVAGRTDR